MKSLKKSGRTRRISRLDKAEGVCAEVRRLYRETRLGLLDSAEATRLAGLLREARAALETTDLARRLEALELEVGSRR